MGHQSEAHNVAQDAQCGNLGSSAASRRLRGLPPRSPAVAGGGVQARLADDIVWRSRSRCCLVVRAR